MKFAEAQFWSIYAQVLRCHAEMVSGAFEDRELYRGALTSPEHRPTTREEKRRHVMAEMRRQVDRLTDQAEYIGTMPQERG